MRDLRSSRSSTGWSTYCKPWAGVDSARLSCRTTMERRPGRNSWEDGRFKRSQVTCLGGTLAAQWQKLGPSAHLATVPFWSNEPAHRSRQLQKRQSLMVLHGTAGSGPTDGARTCLLIEHRNARIYQAVLPSSAKPGSVATQKILLALWGEAEEVAAKNKWTSRSLGRRDERLATWSLTPIWRCRSELQTSVSTSLENERGSRIPSVSSSLPHRESSRAPELRIWTGSGTWPGGFGLGETTIGLVWPRGSTVDQRRPGGPVSWEVRS